MSQTSLTVNEGTQTKLATDTIGGTEYGIVKLDMGTIGGTAPFTGTLLGINNIGTLPNLPGGSIVMTNGTLAALPNLPQGSINVTAGTFVMNSGTLNVGTVVIPSGTLTSGSLSNVAMINAGTVVTSSGTITNSGTTTGVGVVSVLTKGTISLGSVGGIDANAAAQTGQPVAIGGTDSGGTVRTVLVNSAGAMSVSGASSGTFVNLSTGTLNVGTINTGTVVVTVGTVGGAVANAAAQSGNPLSVGGTDSGGTVRTILVDSTGVQRSSGSVVMTVGTVTILPNLPQGSINVTAGTFVGNGGSMIAYGPAAAAAASAGNPLNIGGTDSGGTIRTIKVDSGGLQRVGIDSGTISVLPNLPQGSINVTAGTIGTVTGVGILSAGTISMLNAGTISVLPNLPQGSINVTAGTITTGTLSPIPTIANVTYGTHGTTGVSVFGTLAGGTGSGAGTEIFCTSVSLSIPSTGGSQDVSIGWGSNGGTFQAGTGLIVRGNFPPGGGIQKTFWPPINSGTNGQFMLFQAGAGTVDVSVSYFITPSTI